ncbi:MAG: dipeptidase [Thermoanaerobaculia bacterium]
MKPRSLALAISGLTALFALATWGGGSIPSAAERRAELARRARELTRKFLVVDTHIDVPYRLTEQGDHPDDVGVRLATGDFDAVRAAEGGLDAAFMSIYVAASYQKTGGAKKAADDLIDLVEGIEARHPQLFAIARSPAEVEAAARAGKIALPLGMENGAPVESDLANVGYFFDRGIRYITLTHGEDNQICDSSYAPKDHRTWHGLSPFGRQVVREMNRLGILVDISHVSDDTFDQVIELSAAPPIASHSSCRFFTPGFERNLDDARIRRLAARGGVIQINFGSGFLTAEANAWTVAWQAAAKEFRERTGVADGSPESEGFRDAYLKAHPLPRATVDDVADHIDHVARIAGIDAVGLGSDFDGVGPTLPAGLEDVAKYPNLVAKLLERGYGDDDIRKVLGGNLLRVWREAEAVAERMRRE